MKKIVFTLLMMLGISSAVSAYETLTPQKFYELVKNNPSCHILDCRTAEEFAAGHISGAVMIDVRGDNFKEQALAQFNKEDLVAVYCKSGNRSKTACDILVAAGFKKICNLDTGITGWEKAGYPITKDTMKEIDINTFGKEDEFDLIRNQWMLITAGTKENLNTMTANWGGVGHLWNKYVAFIFVRPDRYTHDFIESNDRVTISFYSEDYREALNICGSKSGRDCDKIKEAGLTPIEVSKGAMSFDEARMTIVCKKLYQSDFEKGGFDDKSVFERWYGGKVKPHTMYIVEIEKILVK